MDRELLNKTEFRAGKAPASGQPERAPAGMHPALVATIRVILMLLVVAMLVFAVGRGCLGLCSIARGTSYGSWHELIEDWHR